MRFEQPQIEAFAARLAAARAAKGLSRQAIVDRVDGLSRPQQLYNYEKAQRAPERVEIVVQLERAVDLAPGTLCRLLGFRPLDDDAPPLAVEDAIASDQRLGVDAKVQLLNAYRRLAR